MPAPESDDDPVQPKQRLTPFERALALVTKVRAGEGRVVALYALHVFLILFTVYIFKAIREGILLDRGGAELASYAKGTIAALLLAIVPLYSSVRRLFDGPQLVLAVIAFFVGCLITFWALDRGGAAIGFPFYVFVGIFVVMMVAQFWALAADTFNVKTGQRLFPVIMLGGQLGALAGAEFVDLFVADLGSGNMLLVAAGALVVTAAFTLQMHASVPAESRHATLEQPHPMRRLFGGFDIVAGSRYLTLIAIMVVLINWISSTGDYILGSQVKAHFEAVAASAEVPVSKRDLISRFYGSFWLWVTVIGLILQTFVVGRLFRWVGVATTLLITPVISLVGYTLIGFLPVLTLIRLVRGAEAATEYSFTNTSRQALFLPMDRAQIYEGKTAIETFFWRFGDLLQAGIVLAGTKLGMGIAAFALLNVALAAFWLAVALLVGKEYRRLAKLNLTNEAPRLARPIPDAACAHGAPFEHHLPHDAFVDSDPGDVMTLSARLADGSPLPAWLQFDHHHGRFHAPTAVVEFDELHVEVTATDHDGMSVSGRFVIRRSVTAG